MGRVKPLSTNGDGIMGGKATSASAGVAAVLAHRPEAARAIALAMNALFLNPTLSPRLVELMRLRLAYHNQCRTCMAMRHDTGRNAGVTEELICSLEKPHEAPDLSAAEQAAIRYGELLATDHLAIDESVYHDLREHFTEEEIVELGTYCAFCVGFGRLGATWNMIEELPKRFHEGQIATPWGGEAITVR